MNKTKVINFRLTERDYDKIQHRSEQCKMSITGYLTTMALDGKIITIDGLPEIANELKRIGNNLNQLTRLCHEGQINCPNLKETKLEVAKLWQSLSMLKHHTKR